MAAMFASDAAPTGDPLDGTASVVDDANAKSPAGATLDPVASEPLSDSDTTTSEGDREYAAGCFEGPEKNIEVCFTPDIGHPNGCRELSRDALDAICAAARCTILTSVSNAHLDAYVLSESSLFVYRHKMVLKTCGTTTLLRCLKPLLKATNELGLELEWLGYSRANYKFPDAQMFPHSSFQEEFGYLKKHPHLSAKLAGEGYILGPITGDHFLIYVADKCTRQYVATERTLNIMMFDMAPEVASHFYMESCPDKEDAAAANHMTAASGIDNLVPGAIIDDRAFDPCGYSMNAILYGSYTTVHITPEQECSYASFETSTPLTSYTALINNVLSTFRPMRVVVTLTGDAEGIAQVVENPFDNKTIHVPGFAAYSRSSASFTKVEGDCCVSMGNWEISAEQGDPSELRRHRKENRIQSI